jgi:putative oxidoreductase
MTMNLPMIATLRVPARRLIGALEWLQPPAQLLARVYIARVFWLSGLTKIRDWETTIALFTDEYKVPLLMPHVAALLATCGELALPVLLVLGLGARFAALGLFVLNAVAAISLPGIGDAALQQHVFWGSLLLALLLWGPGNLSLDAWLARRLTPQKL